MNKTRKTKLYVVLIALVCVIAFCLCACSGVGADGTNGTNGKDGANGKSAYEIWLDEGHTGSQTDFLNWIKGADGKDGQNGSNGQDGTNGTNGSDGVNGDNGADGKSAYQIWLDNGHTGTEAEFLDWLKGVNGSSGANGIDGANGKSAYEIFKQQYPYYQGTEEQWLIALVNGQLRIHAVTFKSEVADDITKYVLNGYELPEIPEVPEKEGQTSAAWSVTDFSSITQDTEVTAVYDMRKYVTFHNEYTDDEDIVKIVDYSNALTDIPKITAKVGNDSKWSISNFSEIKADLYVEAIYETQGLQFVAINQQTEYRVSHGVMNANTEELFIPAEHNGNPVTVIDTNAFSNSNNKFKCLYLPDSIVEIRENAFYGCSTLFRISLNSNINSNINSSTFYNCPITEIEIGALVTEISTDILRHNFTKIEVDDKNSVYHLAGDCLIETASKTLMRGTNKSVIPMDGSVTVIADDAFLMCSGLENITIPHSVTGIGSCAFYGCSSLTKIVIPNSVTMLGNIGGGGGVFQDCSGLTEIILPNTITEIQQRMFGGCSSLASIVIPNSIIEIHNEVFVNCTSLTSIVIPSSVTRIMIGAFSGCSKLETIYYKGTQAEFNNMTVDSSGNTSFTDAMVYYYSEMRRRMTATIGTTTQTTKRPLFGQKKTKIGDKFYG